MPDGLSVRIFCPDERFHENGAFGKRTDDGIIPNCNKQPVRRFYHNLAVIMFEMIDLSSTQVLNGSAFIGNLLPDSFHRADSIVYLLSLFIPLYVYSKKQWHR